MWFSKKIPPQNVRDMVAQSPLSRFNPFRAHVYEAKKLPTPGVQNYAYENLGLTEFSIIGPAVVNRMSIKPCAPDMTFFAVFGTYMQGLGGLATGGIYGQPLVDPTGFPIDEPMGQPPQG